ncbi:MAG: oligoendopeptidase F [Ktedonobacterales bacterium]|nr:oligoendopeptidase F [Ktedonobacterales bacterium]
MTVVQTVPPRSEVPVELTWDLESIFTTDQMWEENFSYTSQQVPKLAALQGSLGQTAQALYQALRMRDQVSEVLERLIVYATMRFHEDTTRTHYQALADRALTLAAEFSAATAFFTPEILAVPQDRLDTYFGQEAGLALYRMQIDDITRMRPHMRSAEVEQVLAGFLELSQSPERVFEMLDNADLPPLMSTITDEEGHDVQLSNGSYGVFLHSTDRNVRRAAFEGLHTTFKSMQNTIGANLGNQVKKNLIIARNRRYDSALAAALDGNNIPTSVYTNLVDTVNANLPKLHRYLALRQKILKLDDGQHIYDLYAPLVAEAKVEVAFDEARDKVAQALGPLGTEYTTALADGMRSRWIDVLENQGKRGGAYSWGAFGTHPFVLLNYHNQLDDMFTLAHEMGHSMHSYFTRATQPYPYADYTIFLAEIASTLNEAMLTHYLLQTTQEPTVRAYIINHYLDGFRATLFRQTMFADFELQIHQRAEGGESLTPELLCSIYKGLNDRYYGDGGVVVDDLIAWEWSRIPHFYSSFYVYQYATGISASAALVRGILSEGQPAVDRYLRLLRSGSSNYSIDLLRDAGVDMTTPEPVEAAIAEFDRYVGEMETLVG